jgi:hypothetical protein
MEALPATHPTTTGQADYINETPIGNWLSYRRTAKKARFRTGGLME